MTGAGSDGYQPIEDYGVVGDLHTVALVGKDGSIDFMCFPEFDSPSIFAALLDQKKGGRFLIAPAIGSSHQRQMYLPGTNVLLTRFHLEEGLAELSDFMPVEGHEYHHDLVRRIKVVRGDLTFRMLCQPRLDYARVEHRVEKRGENEILFWPEKTTRSPALRLRSNVPMKVQGRDAVAEFRLSADGHAWFLLDEIDRRRLEDSRWSIETEEARVSEAFKETVNYWRHWIGRSRYKGRWAEQVHRSALVLKLLTSQHYGTIVAAPTFGLPEVIGGERNWDYRYTWIRDSSFAVYALMRLGFIEETERFMSFIEARYSELDPDGSLQVLYGIDGRHDLEEQTLEHLEGYRRSSPVRIGNNAYRQLQLDIYGELMDAIYLFDRFGYPISHDLWRDVTRLMEWVCRNWNTRDRSIWEIRGKPHHFLYSRMMCWVALDRAIRLAWKRSLPAPVNEWVEARDTIHREIFDEFWSPELGAFIQHKGSHRVDASHLLMPLVKFISPRDPKWLSTLQAVTRDLATDALVRRYSASHTEWDGLAGTEGTFSMCSFWLVEAIVGSGDLQQARFLFEKMLGYGNHLGLYAEELGPCGEHLGNYPQAFTHLSLISAAFDLDRRIERRDGD